MRRFRFTIGGLILVVLALGVAFAALRQHSDAWDSALLGLDLLVLLTSILLSVHRRAEKKAFWIGFALFGWTYLVASLVPPIADRLPTTKALVALGSRIAGPETTWVDDLILTNIRSFDLQAPTTKPVSSPVQAARGDVQVYNGPATSTPASFLYKRLVATPIGDDGRFVRIGHSLLALVIAFLGAILSRKLWHGSESTSRPAKSRPVGPRSRDGGAGIDGPALSRESTTPNGSGS